MRGAAYNALMEEESKSGLAEMCCKLMDELAEAREKIAELQATVERLLFPERAGGRR